MSIGQSVSEGIGSDIRSVPSGIWILVATHILVDLTLIACILYFPLVATMLFLSINRAQLCLLAVWCGVIEQRWRRAALFIPGIAGLTFIIIMGNIAFGHAQVPIRDMSRIFAFLFSPRVVLNVVSASIAIDFLLMVWGFIVVRRNFELTHNGRQRPSLTSGKVRFSIRDILIVTAVAAAVLAATKGVKPYYSIFSWRLYNFSLSRLDLGRSIVNYVSSNFIDDVRDLAITMAATWAVLTAGRIRLRVTITIVMSILAGLIVGIMLFSQISARVLVLDLIQIEVQTLVVIGSLFVARQLGYRLVPVASLK
ncbi:MAG: hypothetical protein K8T25_12495 [Planctomycetia bacterium]|nr:hypothetical protein [Planctomycetia bacterium]